MRRISRRSRCRMASAVSTGRAPIWRTRGDDGRLGSPQTVESRRRNRAISAVCLTVAMTNPRFEAMIRRQTEQLARQLGSEIAQQREDAGLSRRALAAAAGIHHSLLDRVEDGRVRPSNETYLRLAAALGADFKAHLYPNTGPAIGDRFQAPILEGLLGMLAYRWQPSRRPQFGGRRAAGSTSPFTTRRPNWSLRPRSNRYSAGSSSWSAGRARKPTRCHRGMAGHDCPDRPQSRSCSSSGARGRTSRWFAPPIARSGPLGLPIRPTCSRP